MGTRAGALDALGLLHPLSLQVSSSGGAVRTRAGALDALGLLHPLSLQVSSTGGAVGASPQAASEQDGGLGRGALCPGLLSSPLCPTL